MQTVAYLFGNSPTCTLNAELPTNSKIAVLGQGIIYHNLPFVDFWFARSLHFSERLAAKAKATLILSAKSNVKENNFTFITDNESKNLLLKYNVNFLPSLGLFAILWLQQNSFNKIYYSGITTKITDENINGYFWNKNEKRSNLQHNLTMECLILSKLMKDGVLYEF